MMKVRVPEPNRCYHVGVRPAHTGVGTDTLNSGRGELHVETRESKRSLKLWGIQLTPKVLTGYYERGG
jgi:hypothetical protein